MKIIALVTLLLFHTKVSLIVFLWCTLRNIVTGVTMNNLWGMAKRYWQKKKTFEFYWNVAGAIGICVLASSVIMDDSFKSALFPAKETKKIEEK